jgi:uncharacterized protein (TIGR03086 family)
MDRVVVRHSIDLVGSVRVAHLGHPTPCAGWCLGDLLDHMTAQHRGFAAASAGRGADLVNWSVRPAGAQAPARYTEAAEAVLAAFADDDDLDRPVSIPELSRRRPFPFGQAVGFHLVDNLVHCWDIAQSLGVPHGLSDPAIAAALPLARDIPDDPRRQVPGAIFGPPRAYPGDDPMAEILGRTGRTTVT